MALISREYLNSVELEASIVKAGSLSFVYPSEDKWSWWSYSDAN